MTLIDEIFEANRRYAAAFEAGALGVRPRRGIAILTCMDARYTAQAALGFALGDVHVIRNAGGRATPDALRSLVLSAAFLGTRRCIVVHHTNCGLYGRTNQELAAAVREVSGATPEIDFLPFADVEQSVRDDVATVRASAYLPDGYEVIGFVYDVRTGRVSLVEG
ncbi:MAG: carbonic anhydrase [Chloroflexi bacterium]|nr:carbonic anhydrase [Chloroflexota bacterium]